MKHLYYKLLSFFNTIEGKIAFYPTLFAIAGLTSAFVFGYLETLGVSKYLLENAPVLILQDGNTALSVLSVCMGGLISMMVFSFSMVMLLLSQASSNFSPRLLPGLISDRKNQIILGTYLGSIIYMIFILFSIEPEDKKYTLPGLSILIAIVLTIFCLGAFIYFIHNMSQSIQINNILESIFEKSKRRLNDLIEKETHDGQDIINTFPKDLEHWHTYTTHRSGYFQNISLKNVIEICETHQTRVYFSIPKGFYVQHHIPFLHTEKALPDDVVEKLYSNINYSRSEFVEDNYILALKQITEIILKAMSPGINDPGTALNAIDYLTELLALRMRKNDSGVMVLNGKAQVRIAIVSFKELLYNIMASMRTYCAHDPLLVQKMIWMLSYLRDRKEIYSEKYVEAINSELAIVTQAAMENITNKTDLETIKKMSDNGS